ncbi:MAG: GtrA family protein [Vallitaleaceae bacterium]|nr:GtrA family protein [Vallitaleaceae bacterium]
MKQLIRHILKNEKWMRIVRYLIIGVMTTGVSFLTFWVLCYPLAMDPNLANIISIAAAIAFAYVTNKIIVFKSKKENFTELVKEAISFVLSRGITIVVEMGGVFVMVSVIKWDPMISKILISVFVIILNYIISQFWVFKEVGKK